MKIRLTLFIFFLSGTLITTFTHSLAQNRNDKTVQSRVAAESFNSKSPNPPLDKPKTLNHNKKQKSVGPRILSLSPALTEILFLIGAEAHLVGTTNHSNYPAAAKKIPTVGDYLNPSIEKIVSLKPDLVLINDEWPDSIFDSLRRMKISFKVLPLKRLEDLEHTIEALGEVLSKPEGAHKLKTEWTTWYQEVALKNRDETKNRVTITSLSLVEVAPMIAVGDTTYLSELMTFCGFKNLLQQPGYPRIERETLVKLKPDVIVYFDNMVKPVNRVDVKNQIRRLLPNAKITFANGDSLSRLTPSLMKDTPTECESLKRQLQEPT